MTLPDWQKRDWVNVPPGTTPPEGAPVRDAAWHEELDEFLSEIPAAIGEAAESGGGSDQSGESDVRSLVVGGHAISAQPGSPYSGRMFLPAVEDLTIAGARVHYCTSGLAYQLRLFRLSGPDFQVGTGYDFDSITPELVGLQEFNGTGFADNVDFETPIDLVQGGKYEIGVGMDTSQGGYPPIAISMDYASSMSELTVWGFASYAQAANGQEGRGNGTRVPVMTLFATRSGSSHTSEPATITDPYYTPA